MTSKPVFPEIPIYDLEMQPEADVQKEACYIHVKTMMFVYRCAPCNFELTCPVAALDREIIEQVKQHRSTHGPR